MFYRNVDGKVMNDDISNNHAHMTCVSVRALVYNKNIIISLFVMNLKINTVYFLEI